MQKTSFSGIFFKKDPRGKKSFYTINLVPGKTVYDERLVSFDGKEFREWNPMKSKLGAGVSKSMKLTGIKEGSSVLYLGAASGTTVSHVSDIVGKKGLIYAVDLSHRVLRELVFISEDRKNIVPVLADANNIDLLSEYVLDVDVLFQDIAQKAQLNIFLKNMCFLKKGGIGLLALKARSIDVTKNPKKIFGEIKRELEKHVELIDAIDLAPLEMDHCLYVCKKK